MCDRKAKGELRTLNANIQRCSKCNAAYEQDSFDPRQKLTVLMKQRELCFQCAFWIDKIEKPPEYAEVVNGSHFTFHPWNNSPLAFQGSGGHAFYIIRENGSVLKSNNVWRQGDVPERFREQLPDTARFISKRTYSQLNDNSFVCKAKGCWDRYNCYRYDLAIEETAGPWNVVPQSHTLGDEKCESFINKNKL